MKLRDVGNRYKYARLYAGYTQREAAKASGFMTPQALSHYEKGTRLPSNMILYTLPKLYNVSLDFLLEQSFYINHDEYIKEVIYLDQQSIDLLKAAKMKHHTTSALKQFMIQLKEELHNDYRKEK